MSLNTDIFSKRMYDCHVKWFVIALSASIRCCLNRNFSVRVFTGSLWLLHTLTVKNDISGKTYQSLIKNNTVWRDFIKRFLENVHCKIYVSNKYTLFGKNNRRVKNGQRMILTNSE